MSGWLGSTTTANLVTRAIVANKVLRPGVVLEPLEVATGQAGEPMNRPSRHVPRVGDRAEVVYLGAREPAVITAIDGASVEVRTADGGRQVFDLNRVTAHFVLRGEPYWGARLRVIPTDDGERDD